VNEMAMNVWQHHFPEPYAARGVLWDKLPTEVVEMATLSEFYENYRFFTIFCDPFFFTHYMTKKT
jgi:hypothetical protein